MHDKDAVVAGILFYTFTSLVQRVSMLTFPKDN